MVLYRGSLKSCNYHCSYCPFSKHGMTQKELKQDQEQWFAFVRRMQIQAEASGTHAVMITPYGEALIHAWYWEGLAGLSRLPQIEAAGAQTNLGFSVSWAAGIFEKHGGNAKKLRLWATFHPEMTTVDAFARACEQLAATGIQISAGAVGVPENIDLLRQLRRQLPNDIYVWINRMDGLGRAYTEKEIQAFSQLDPYFYRELQVHPANAKECTQRLFTEGDGRLRMCNISTVLRSSQEREAGVCGRKRCSCYLAYGGRNNLVNQMLFGPWPLFRIPRCPKAVFIDIVGTLYAKGEISKEVREALYVLSLKEKSLLFFATTLPYNEARKRCGPVWHLFSGGVFAGGAHLLYRGTQTDLMQQMQKESFYFMEEAIVKKIEPLCRSYHFRMLVYRAKGRCYKLTLLRAHTRMWEKSQAEAVLQHLPQQMRDQVRYIIEDGCLQLVAAAADKACGVRTICTWLKIPVSDVFAVGDSQEDVAMMELNQWK